MKLRLLTVIFALVVPLAACNASSNKSGDSTVSNSSSSSSAVSPSPSSSSVTTPTSNSPILASPSNTTQKPNTELISNWYTYSSEEGSYSAKFPEKPVEEKKAANSKEGAIGYVEVRYVDNAKQRIYLTGHAAIPIPQGAKKNEFNIEKGLDGGRNGMVKAMGATVNSETKITQGESLGRELKMTLPNGVSAKARIFINQNNLKAYQAIVATKDGKIDFPEATAFLDSLAIASK